MKLFLQNNKLIRPEQAGFRKGFSTTDHIFVLHSLIELYKAKGKRLYCCFVDYNKAFDSIERLELWKKVINSNINGRVFNVIFNLYKNAKSCVSSNGQLSDYFTCNIGVRQGENLSPLLFSIFLNDLESFMASKYDGLIMANNTITDCFEDELIVYIKLFLLLYADDTVILSESPKELQKALNGMYEYCKCYKLEVNAQKTKVR